MSLIRHRAHWFAGACVLFATAAAPAAAAEHLALDLADAANGVSGGVAAQSQPLAAGAPYVVTISGTGSLWTTTDAYTDLCGEPEPGAITEPSAGKPATPPTMDAAVVFAAPKGVDFLGGQACTPPNSTSPPSPGRLMMGSAAAGMAPAVPIGGQPAHAAANHRYAYAVTGDGTALQLQYDDGVTYDNSGILRVTIWTQAECDAVDCTVADPVATPTPSPGPAPTPSPTPSPSAAGTPTPAPAAGGSAGAPAGGSSGAGGGSGAAGSSGALVPTAGSGVPGGASQQALPESVAAAREALLTAKYGDACVNTNVLSVRLVAKRRTRLASAVFWIDGKRVRTVKGRKLYVSLKTKRRVLRVQKFRKLPKVKFTLKASIRTTGGKRYRLKQTYYRCTPPRKVAKALPVK